MLNLNPQSDIPTVIDLFCGAGGFSLGFEKAGFKVVSAIDNHLDPIKTYLYNRWNLRKDIAIFINDIKKLNGRKIINAISNIRKRESNIDVIIGGPPCQGFSMRGKKELKDPRNRLVFEFFRIVKDIKPSIFVFENVSSLVYGRNKIHLKKILNQIDKLRYNFSFDILNASDYGVPQNRNRLFIIGNKISNKVIFPRKSKNVTQKDVFKEFNILYPEYNAVPVVKKKICNSDAMNDIAFNSVQQTPIDYKGEAKSTYQKLIRHDSTRLYNHITTNHKKSTIEVFKQLKPGQNLKELPKSIRPNRRSCKRMDDIGLARTITSCNEDFVHYSLNRIITIREMARLQSYPDSYIFKGTRTTGSKYRKHSCCQVQQVANSVPPLLSQAIAECVLKMLNIKSNGNFKKNIDLLNGRN